MSDLPDGFVLDKPSSNKPSTNQALPDGFVLDKPKSSPAGDLWESMQKVQGSPGGPPVIPSLMNMAKGVPILGHLVPQTEAMTKLEQEQPTKAGFQKLAGGAMAMAPASYAATGSRFVPTLARQMGLGGGASGGDLIAGDKIAGKSYTNDDMLHALALGGASGALGPVSSKMLTPNPYGIGPTNLYKAPGGVTRNSPAHEKLADIVSESDLPASMLKSLNRVADINKAQMAAHDIASKSSKSSPYVGAALGFLTGDPHNAILGGLMHHYGAKALTTDTAQKLMTKYLTNPSLSSKNQAIINALITESSRNITKPPDQ